MNRIIHFGASGNAGKMIAAALKARGYELTVVVRNQQKARELKYLEVPVIVANVRDAGSIRNSCAGFDIVVSSLGKSVSPNDRSRGSFRDIDLEANTIILNEAQRSGVKKFVYLSVFHAERYPQVEYFSTHYEFEQRLKGSGLDYSIIRPPALFSSFVDLMAMAKKGRLVTLGSGDKHTNPIYEGDLAGILVDSINQKNALIEAGGPEILTRKAINEIIQQNTAPGRKVRTLPLGIFRAALPLIKLFDRNTYDKFAFFLAVMQEDTVAPQLGSMRLAEYIKARINAS